MKGFGEVDASALRWLPVEGEHPDFQLLAGSEEVARLSWSAGRGSLATGVTRDASWTFKRAGFLSPHVTARLVGGTADAAKLSLHWSSSLLEVAGNGTFRLLRRGTLVPTWEFVDQSGTAVLNEEAVREHSTLVGGLVTVAPKEVARPELPILLLTAWYFLVQAWAEEDAASQTQAALIATYA